MDTNFGYYLRFVLICIVLVGLCLFVYWKCIRPFADFPKASMYYCLIEAYILRKKPKDMPFLTHAFQRMIIITKEMEQHGMCLTWFPLPLLFIFSEEAVKIFSQEQACVDKHYHYTILEDTMGLGLVTSNGERWRNQRKRLNPVFHYGVHKDIVPIFNDHAELLVKDLAEIMDKPTTNLLDYLKLCSFGNLCESLLGLKMNTEENKVIIKNYVETITQLFLYTSYRMVHLYLYFKSFLYFIPSGRKYLQLCKDNKNFTKKVVSDIKEAILSREIHEDDSEELKRKRKSFTHILMELHLKDPSFTLEDLQDELRTFMSAGFDTVAYTTMWCLFMLGLHADVQESAYNEVMSETSKNISYEEVCNLEYLECIIKETLRLYPTVPFYGRYLRKNVQCGKYLVPKGTSIVFVPYVLHRNPKLYPDPEKFEPERFLPGTSNIPPWAFVSFSEGIRSCIGKKFALLQMKVILAFIIRNYKITSLDKREDVKLSWNGILAPLEPLRMQFTQRK